MLCRCSLPLLLESSWEDNGSFLLALTSTNHKPKQVGHVYQEKSRRQQVSLWMKDSLNRQKHGCVQEAVQKAGMQVRVLKFWVWFTELQDVTIPYTARSGPKQKEKRVKTVLNKPQVSLCLKGTMSLSLMKESGTCPAPVDSWVRDTTEVRQSCGHWW